MNILLKIFTYGILYPLFFLMEICAKGIDKSFRLAIKLDQKTSK